MNNYIRELKEEEECKLFGTFSIIVQGILAIASFSILICKILII